MRLLGCRCRLRASVSSGSATNSDRFVATPVGIKIQIIPSHGKRAGGDRSSGDTGDPIELPQRPNSFRRMKAPRWNSIARKPPPDRQRPIPSSSFCPPRKSAVTAAAASMGSSACR